MCGHVFDCNNNAHALLSFLNVILCAGNSLYTCLSNSVNKTDVPEMVSASDKMYSLQYSDAFAGDLFMATNNLPFYSLQNALNSLFLDSQLNYQHCLLIATLLQFLTLLKGTLKFLTLIQEIPMAYHTHLENVC